ncbi:ankyrin repeat domain-containing protein 53 [Anableps anableps]
MKRANTRRKRSCGQCKIRKVLPKAPACRPVLPDVGMETSEVLEEELPPLHLACLHGKLQTVQELVESKPWCINSSDPQGRRPLHIVLCSQCSNINTCLRYLLEHGADVNATTDVGQSPLHWAVSGGLLDCSEILMKAGADILAKDRTGLTPLDIARLWCHRKIARSLKHSLWHSNKEKEMEEIKLTQVLYRDLIKTVKQKNLDEKSLIVIDKKMEEWAKTKGLAPLKAFFPRVQVSKYHNQCILPEQTHCQPKPTKGQSKGLQETQGVSTTQLPSLSNSPWTVFAGLQPEKPLIEPDLRDSVILWKDISSQRLQYMTKWDSTPHPTPDLPLDVVERVLFPRAFPSRIATSRDFEPQNVEKLQHRGVPQERSTSPWTEVAIYLDEFLELRHYKHYKLTYSLQ